MLYTNSGKNIINKEADIPGYGCEYFDENPITNLFALKDLITRGRVQFDSGKNAFKVQIGRNIMNFIADPKGLYILDTEKQNKCHPQAESLSQREITRAKKKRRLCHQFVAPSVAAFKSLLRHNLIKNCEVMEKYI